MAPIDIDSLHKRFGAEAVIKDINLCFEEGEFIVLVGPSGCSKSTLLRMIAGLESIRAGEIRMDGKRINELPQRDSDIAMVFQSYALYPHMDVSRNMGFSMEIQCKEKSARHGKIRQAAEQATCAGKHQGDCSSLGTR